MSVLEPVEVGGQWFLDEAQCRAAGEPFAEQYASATPFAHIALDEFLPRPILRELVAEFPSSEGHDHFNRNQERLKFGYHPQECGPKVRHALAELNSQAFLAFLTAMTGIKGLIADPYYFGGGLHETKRGGHLGMHADFNIHRQMNVVRRLNLLVYLNEDWAPEYGGDLELWDTDMKGCEKKVAPTFARAVVFSTALDTFHGHPDPLTCPPDNSRKSIALYYYTAAVEGLATVPKRTTVFKERPGSTDKLDWYAKALHFWKDWAPPAIQRMRSSRSAD